MTGPSPAHSNPDREAEEGDFQIQAAGPAERGAQVELFEACFGQAGGADVLAWRYDRCPHGTPVTLLGLSGGQPVSGYACNPRRIGWQGEGVTVGQTGDVMSHPEQRSKGYFSRLDRAAMKATDEQGWPVVFGLPNRQSAHLFIERLGWKGVGHLRPWTFVLSPGRVARDERLRAGRLASALTPWAHWKGRRVRKAMAARVGGYQAYPVERFEAWVEPLAQRVAERFTWMVRRDAAYLNWRFFDSPNARFKALRIDAADGQLAAYAVWQRPTRGARLAFLVDLVGIDELACEAALEAVMQELEVRDIQVIRSHAIRGSAWESFLSGHAFQAPKPQDEKWVIAYVHQPDHPLAQAALDPKSWFFTDADRDDELVR